MYRSQHQNHVIFSEGLPTPPDTWDVHTGRCHTGKDSQSLQYHQVERPRERFSSRTNISLAVNGEAGRYHSGSDTTKSRHNSEDGLSSQVGNYQLFLGPPRQVGWQRYSIQARSTARITAFLWCETYQTIKAVETHSHAILPHLHLKPCTSSISNFSDWIARILNVMQLADSADTVLLSLMYIYQLKSALPDLSGLEGSEYRILVVVLMLGNKYLADRPYKGITWAEVSGISLDELRTMEVEVLHIMQYRLHVTREQWFRWKQKVQKFAAFCGTASCVDSPDRSTSRRVNHLVHAV